MVSEIQAGLLVMAKSRSSSSEFGAFSKSSTMFAVGYSLPITGVKSSNGKAASNAPFCFNGPSLRLLKSSDFDESRVTYGVVALGAMFRKFLVLVRRVKSVYTRDS